MGMPSNFTEILAALSSALECAPLQTDERGRVLFGLDEDMGAVLFTEKNEDSGEEAVVACVGRRTPRSRRRGNCCAMCCAPLLWSGLGDGTLA